MWSLAQDAAQLLNSSPAVTLENVPVVGVMVLHLEIRREQCLQCGLPHISHLGKLLQPMNWVTKKAASFEEHPEWVRTLHQAQATRPSAQPLGPSDQADPLL